jgi:phosphoenolpyruvate synthase/pyruvate phosphate dikinase
MSENKQIDWFWAHRRNTSLHHMSIFAAGLRGKGWEPAVNFWFNNQIYVGIPKKGVYIFYDKNQLNSKDKYKDIQDSIDNNKNFVSDYQKQTDKLFGELFSQCDLIDKADLKSLSKDDLHNLYSNFIKAITAGPIITVQLWGIEALWDRDYIIAKFLRKAIKSEAEFQKYKEILSTNTGETVAFTEQKDLYKAAVKIDKPEIVKLFEDNSLEDASKKLLDFKKENGIVENHIKEYEWVNTEYISGGWSREKWLELFKKALLDSVRPKERLKEIIDNFESLNKQRSEAIAKLNPPKNVRHALGGLADLIAQRDWSKGWFAKSLLSYSKLLDEISQRIDIDYLDIFNYSYEEIFEYFINSKIVSKEELVARKEYGFIYIVKNGQPEIVSGQEDIKELIKTEGISGPFDKVEDIKEFQGLSASRGKIQGIARVLEDASKIPEFKKGEIIVTYMTTMEFTPIFRKASAVVTDEGGMSCHAAIVSREFKLPCIVGTKVATRVIKTGDKIEVDADKGIVKIL